jgi:hypothetical protein
VAAQVPAKFTHHDRHAMGSGQDWKKEQKAMLEGVVNLKNTEDTDTDVQVAPGKSPWFCQMSQILENCNAVII